MGKSMADVSSRPVMLRRFGWAFLLAWVFCVFYAQLIGTPGCGLIGESSPDNELILVFCNGLPVFMSVVMLVAVVCGEKRWGSPVSHGVLLWAAPAATAFSTPLLFLNTGISSVDAIAFVLGSMLTGFGSGLMWVMWGEYYAKISQADVEMLAPASAAVAGALVLVVSAMSGWVAMAVVVSFPLLAGWCLIFSWKGVSDHVATAEHLDPDDCQAYRDAHNVAVARPVHVARSMGRSGVGILTACFFVCVAGAFWSAPHQGSLAFQASVLIGIAFVGVIGFSSTIGPRRVSLSFLYRWMCPMLVVGFCSLVVFGAREGGYVAYVVSLASRFAFCLITQMFFARFAASGRATAVQSFGLGWICVHVGDFLGVLAINALEPGLMAGTILVDHVAAVCVSVLVIATMFVLNDERSFELAEAPSRDNDDRVPAVVANVQADSLDRIALLASRYELTPRETEVFELLARGRSVPYIRDALVISKETAATHTKHVYAKLGIHSRQELIDLAHSEE